MDKNKFDLLDFNKLLKASDVADLLNISKAFAYQLMRQGELSFIKIGNAIRVRPIDLQNYIELNYSNTDVE
ncbi:MAG: helix-turn-helix domain-containing protein [Chloroflexi bacterium]|jgi:excisionase family DNA binding protein|nr:helix-turn-helix domain-containing protein [Chloroflexota bacterium]